MTSAKQREYAAKYREKNRDTIRAKAREWYAANREKKMAYNAAHREEKAAYNRAYREAHFEEIAAKQAAYREAHRAEARQRTAAHRAPAQSIRNEFYSTGCSVCGIAYLPAIMSAHHVDPSEKERSVNKTHDVNAVRAELSKCVPVCLNCHALIHAALRNGMAGSSLEEVSEHVRAQLKGVLP